jgi:hypothetical protein
LSYRLSSKLLGGLLCLFDWLSGLWFLGGLELLLHCLVADRLSLHLFVRELSLDNDLLKTELFLLIVEFEVIKQLCTGLKVGKDLQHFFANLWVDLLAVSSLASRLVLVVWILNMDELGIWNILDVNPLNSDGTRPFS